MIRTLTAADQQQWLLLWTYYQDFYQVQLGEDHNQLIFARLLDEREPMYCLVFEQDQQLLGMVHYIFHRSTWSQGDVCYLQDLYVIKQSRGMGIGKSLIQAVYTVAQQQHCSKVYWLTHETNTQAQIVYDQIAEPSGFIQYRKNLG